MGPDEGGEEKEKSGGQGTWTSTSGLAAEKIPVYVWKWSSQLRLIWWKHLISDHRRPSSSFSLGRRQKCSLSVSSLHETGHWLLLVQQTSSAFFLLFQPSPHSPALATHCIHTFKCKIKLLTFLPALNPPPCCVIYFFPLLSCLSTSQLRPGSSNEAPHCPPRSQSSIKRKVKKKTFTKRKENPGWAEK